MGLCLQFDDYFTSDAITTLPFLYKTSKNRIANSETETAQLKEGRSYCVSLLCDVAMLLMHFIFVEG